MYFYFFTCLHSKVTAHLVTARATAPAFARKAGAVCTNCLLRAATCSGSCVRTADSDTPAPPRRRQLTVLLCRQLGCECRADDRFDVLSLTPHRGSEGNDY